MKKALTYTAILVGIYIVVSNATDAGRLLGSGSKAYNSAVKTLQGRG